MDTVDENLALLRLLVRQQRQPDTPPPQTFAEIVRAFGGYATLAMALRVTKGQINHWQRRNSIPPQYWQAVVKASKAVGIEGVTYERLAEMALTLPRRGRSMKPPA